MKTRNNLPKRLAALLTVLCMSVVLAVSAFAAETNEKVTQDTTGVVQVKVVYTDDNHDVWDVASGTGFLINNSTVITCNHVVTADDELLAQASETFNKSIAEVKERLGIEISVLRDVTIRATVRNQSAEMDYAILNLESQLYDRTYLPIRSSATVQQTESVYALGFPGEVSYFQDVNTYTSDDVTITNGQINKLNTIGGVDYVQSSARITSGNSGGPLVDAEGNVVGICQGATRTGFDANYFYAIAIDQLTRTLDSLGIEYTSAGGAPAVGQTTEPEPAADETEPAPVDKAELNATIADAQAIDLSGYDDESGAALTAALENALSVQANEAATQDDVNAAINSLSSAQLALVPKSGLPIWLIIVAAAVVVIVIVAIILIVSGKKKKSAVPQPQPMGSTPTPSTAPLPPSAPVAPVAPAAHPAAPAQGGFAPAPKVAQNNFPAAGAGAGATSLLNTGAGETSILSAGSEETTLLDQKTSYGVLTRTKSKEKITINAATFVIGKELAKVNYCVSDNTSVSRTHVRLTSRNGAVYVTDLKTTNGTFVNGVRLAPNKETELHDGDKLALADEEFVFSAK